MSSARNKVVAVFLIACIATLVPLQTVSAQLALCNTNDVSNWIYVPEVPGDMDGNGWSAAVLMNKITGETQATPWRFKPAWAGDTGEYSSPSSPSYWTVDATSMTDEPVQILGDIDHPPITAEDVRFRPICKIFRYHPDDTPLEQDRSTGKFYLGRVLLDPQWDTAKIQTQCSTSASASATLNQQTWSGSGGDWFGSLIGTALQISVSVAIGFALSGAISGIVSSLGGTTAINIAVSDPTATGLINVGGSGSIGCAGVCGGIEGQFLNGVPNTSGANLFGADYTGSFVQVDLASLAIPALINYDIGSATTWTIAVGDAATACEEKIDITKTEITPASAPAGVCGSAIGVSSVDAPSSNLCSTGTATSPGLFCEFLDDGFCNYSGWAKWQWSCDSTSCEAPATPPATTVNGQCDNSGAVFCYAGTREKIGNTNNWWCRGSDSNSTSDDDYCTFSTTVTPTPVTPTPAAVSCGTANGKTYTYGSTGYGADTQCTNNGTPINVVGTAFPAAGNVTTWNCL